MTIPPYGRGVYASKPYSPALTYALGLARAQRAAWDFLAVRVAKDRSESARASRMYNHWNKVVLELTGNTKLSDNDMSYLEVANALVSYSREIHARRDHA
jgi:hypothetical protein